MKLCENVFIKSNIKSACGLQEEVSKLLWSILVNMMIEVASSQNVSPSTIFLIELELWNVVFYCRMQNSFEYLAYFPASIDQ